MVTAGADRSTSGPWTTWTLTRLCRLVGESGGWVGPAQLASLYAEDPRHWNVFQAAGGFKRFCLAHRDRLEWVDGWVRLRQTPPEEPSPDRRRVPRLAGAFAGAIAEYVERSPASREELSQAWEAFCAEKGEASGGFGKALYLLVRWHVLARAGRGRFRLVGRGATNFRRRAPLDTEGALEGERPPLLVGEFASPVGAYHMPVDFSRLRSLDVYAMQREVRRLLCETYGFAPRALTVHNFQEYHHALLFTEELQMLYDISLYDLEVSERLEFDGHLHTVSVPGLAEKRPSVLRGDTVLVKCQQGRFVGYVHQVLLDRIKVSFNRTFQNRPPFTIQFSFSRTPLRTMHRAIDEFEFPECLVSTTASSTGAGEHEHLNREQRLFLGAALQPRRRTRFPEPPLLLWGPPGTGKTTTLVHTIIAILRQQPSAKILVTAPSNPASDLLCEKLAEQGVSQSEMLRLVAVSRDHRHLSARVLDFTRTDRATGFFAVPELAELQLQRVVVATCTAAAYVRSRLMEPTAAWFTHVFVDEAAQAMEAEVLVPLALRKGAGRAFLVGDFKQLGPVIRSPVAIDFGLDVPLMDRIVQSLGHSNARVVSLLDTYRAHRSILRLYNRTVYGDMLRCRSPASSYDMEAWPECPRDESGAPHPILFHHCDGQEARTRGSPSWQNVQEGDLVKTYLMRLLAFGVAPEDIGIISPYHQQCQRLRYICMGEGVAVEVGTTELFQGREKRVIIISTVRSRQEEAIAGDLRFSLGFLGNYKRTNVALSRARSLLIVVGNLALLSRDATWHNVLRLARGMGCMRGPPFQLAEPVHGENSSWTGPRALQGAEEGRFDGVSDRPWRDHF